MATETQEERFERIVAEQLAEKEAAEAAAADPRARKPRGESDVSRQLRETREARLATEAAEAAQRNREQLAVEADEQEADLKNIKKGFFESLLPSNIGNVLDPKRSAEVVEQIDPATDQIERQKQNQTTNSSN